VESDAETRGGYSGCSLTSALPDDTFWALEPHTRAKHEILRRHLDAWLPIMASANDRIMVFDFFAGPGRYLGGEQGSPIVALRALAEHAHLRRLRAGQEIRFVFVEERSDRARHLEREVAAFINQHPLPTGASTRIINDTFADALNSILTSVERSGSRLAPAFAFIDPVGFSGVPMDLITRFAKNPRCEALISFMLEPINRWAWHGEESLGRHLDELFGASDWRVLSELTGEERRDALIILKQAMWKVDPVSGQIFSDRVALDPQLLLVPATTPPPPLRNALQARFDRADWVPIEDVLAYVLTDTVYSEVIHLKRQTLAPMEREGILQVRRRLGAKNVPGQYPPGTLLKF